MHRQFMENYKTSDTTSQFSLYIHVPFCQTKCPYCDFNTYSGIEYQTKNYLDALVTEIRQWGPLLTGMDTRSIFFGGGTPSYISVDHIEQILYASQSSFDVNDSAEITIETNPGDLSISYASSLRRIGVNRLSLGTQSLDDSLLQVIGRRHSAKGAMLAYDAARTAGFDNINLDFMYGLPYQSMDQWNQTLRAMIDMSPEHLSLYCLTLEDGTPLKKNVDAGHIPEPDADLAAEMYLVADSTLKSAGYVQYEISNWCRPGRESQHNLNYWYNNRYLGLGPGAHSFLGNYRFKNINAPVKYIKSLDQKFSTTGEHVPGALTETVLQQIPSVDDIEYINPQLEMAETMMLSLRLMHGISSTAFRNRFGVGLLSTYGKQIRECEDLDLLVFDEDILRLSENGRLLSNEVFVKFF